MSTHPLSSLGFPLSPCHITTNISSKQHLTSLTLWCSNPAAAKSLQSCPTLCDPIDGSPLGSSVPGILQASILEWVAISFSNAWKWKVKVKSLSRAQLLATPWTGAYQAPLSMGFFQARVLGVPLPSPIWKSTLCEMLGWMKHKLESRLLG